MSHPDPRNDPESILPDDIVFDDDDYENQEKAARLEDIDDPLLYVKQLRELERFIHNHKIQK